MPEENWIFISTHLDDAALSCGALVWDLARSGDQVSIWTIMAGFPANDDYSEFARENHEKWGKTGIEAIETRREEDRAACRILRAGFRHFDYPDVIYRDDPETGEPMVNNDDELFGKAPDAWLVTAIAEMLDQEVPADARLVLPIGLGGHIDHRVVVSAGERYGKADFYYADYPYILKAFDAPALKSRKYDQMDRRFSKSALKAWQKAVLCYRSQLSDFWRDDDEELLSIRNYLAGGGGRPWVKGRK